MHPAKIVLTDLLVVTAPVKNTFSSKETDMKNGSGTETLLSVNVNWMNTKSCQDRRLSEGEGKDE